jgi:hypothetical protein
MRTWELSRFSSKLLHGGVGLAGGFAATDVIIVVIVIGR